MTAMINLTDPAQQSQAQAILQGVLSGLVAAAPAVAAADPRVEAVVGITQALLPAVQMALMFQQGGLLTAEQTAKLITDMQSNVTNAHSAWVASVVAHPGT